MVSIKDDVDEVVRFTESGITMDDLTGAGQEIVLNARARLKEAKPGLLYAALGYGFALRDVSRAASRSDWPRVDALREETALAKRELEDILATI